MGYTHGGIGKYEWKIAIPANHEMILNWEGLGYSKTSLLDVSQLSNINLQE